MNTVLSGFLTVLAFALAVLAQPLIAIKRTTTVLSTKRPLLYRTGTSEGIESVTIDASTVSTNSEGRKILEAGSLLTRITATKRFGPYASGASDGRQTLAAPTNLGVTAVILTADIDVTDGNKAIGGYFAFCHFNNADLTLFSATQSAVRAAFPTCTGL